MLPGSTLGLDRPVALMGIAEKGYMTVELQAEAEPGHSSRPRRQPPSVTWRRPSTTCRPIPVRRL